MQWHHSVASLLAKRLVTAPCRWIVINTCLRCVNIALTPSFSYRFVQLINTFKLFKYTFRVTWPVCSKCNGGLLPHTKGYHGVSWVSKLGLHVIIMSILSRLFGVGCHCGGHVAIEDVDGCRLEALVASMIAVTAADFQTECSSMWLLCRHRCVEGCQGATFNASVTTREVLTSFSFRISI